MPFVLIFAGALLAAAAYNGTGSKLFALLREDLTGNTNFIKWVFALVIIGFLGYIPKIKPLADAFLVLVLVAMFLSNRGFFANFQQALSSATASAEKQPTDSKYVEFTPPKKEGGGLFGAFKSAFSTASTLATFI